MSKLFLFSSNIKENLDIAKKNPHCIQFFTNNNNIKDCTYCLDNLVNNDIIKIQEKKYLKLYEKQKNINKNKINKECLDCLKESYIYPLSKFKWEKENDDEVDKIKSRLDIKNNNFFYKIDNKPPIKTQTNFPKPLTMVHWGQLKCF